MATETNQKTVAAAQWTVIDKNAVAAPRKHDIIIRMFDDGREPLTKTYTLNAETGTPMPMEHAMKFLSDPAFEVTSSDGHVMTPPPKNEGGTGSFQIPDHQVIANLDELTTSSLFKRCKVIPGSETMTVQTSREDMVEFLTAYRKKLRTPDGVDEVAESMVAGKADVGGVAPKSQLDAMFGDSPLLQNQH